MPISIPDVLLMDGGMGQMLLKRSQKPPTPLWSGQFLIDDPQLVTDVHLAFIAAGAQLIKLNNYTLTPQRLARDAHISLFKPLHQQALMCAQQARDASGKSVLIAGCLPPLVASYHADVVPDDATCLDSYRQMVALQQSEVDLFIAETLSLIREAEAATMAGVESQLPTWVAFTVDDQDGTCLRSGESLRKAAEAVIAKGAQAVLVNCSVPEMVTLAMAELSGLSVPFGGYANGFTSAAALQPGETVSALSTRTDLNPTAYAQHAMQWVALGARMIGGCCEVGPDHIAELHQQLKNHLSQT